MCKPCDLQCVLQFPFINFLSLELFNTNLLDLRQALPDVAREENRGVGKLGYARASRCAPTIFLSN